MLLLSELPLACSESSCDWSIFFFQAEDGIRDLTVTGVQTCALPIFEREVVAGSVQNGSIVFTVRATPKSAGTHTVHGVFRFSYHNGGELDIRAAPFEATVTATE